MESSTGFFDPVLLRNMTSAFEAVMSRCTAPHTGSSSLRSTVARHIVDAARAGERDSHRLEMSASSRVEASTGHPGAQTTTERLPVAHRNSA